MNIEIPTKIKEKYGSNIDNFKISQICPLLYDTIRIKIESPIFINKYHLSNKNEYFIDHLDYIIIYHIQHGIRWEYSYLIFFNFKTFKVSIRKIYKVLNQYLLEMINMSIIQTIKKIFDSKNIGDIEPMKQETHIPDYIPPLVVPGVKNSPRMKYKRRWNLFLLFFSKLINI